MFLKNPCKPSNLHTLPKNHRNTYKYCVNSQFRGVITNFKWVYRNNGCSVLFGNHNRKFVDLIITEKIFRFLKWAKDFISCRNSSNTYHYKICVSYISVLLIWKPYTEFLWCYIWQTLFCVHTLRTDKIIFLSEIICPL